MPRSPIPFPDIHSSFHPTPLRFALIGCGHIARDLYSTVIAELADQITVVALCDRNRAGAQELASKCFANAHVYTTTGDMLKNEDLDAVMVLTTESANASVAKEVLAAGLPVYLEKPPAISVESLKDLIAAESCSKGCVYTAFNRRHIPLFQNMQLPGDGLKKVTGVLSRTDRTVESFPFTSVHLIDSVQFYGGSPLAALQCQFTGEGTAAWRLCGMLENGATCELTLTPKTRREEEYLILETADGQWKQDYPDCSGNNPEVRLISGGEAGADREETDQDSLHPFRVMGYEPCLRRFVEHVRRGDLPDSAHRLAFCLQTITVLELLRTEASFPMTFFSKATSSVG